MHKIENFEGDSFEERGSSMQTLFPGEGRSGEPLYIQLFLHYRELITSGALRAGARLPSIRRCSEEFSLSRTTVENAYLQLAAEGYAEPRAGSGFYVTALPLSELRAAQQHTVGTSRSQPGEAPVRYDLATTAVDRAAFDFSLWQRYIKSALRQTDRLLTYGEPQGEADLRAAVARYISERRGVICDASQIVIGAGVQPLLQILCALTPTADPVAMTQPVFAQGAAIFADCGRRVLPIAGLDEELSALRESGARLLYTSPSHMGPGGGILPISARLKLLAYAAEHGLLVIEDDYDSDFRFTGRPVPALQGLDGGQRVAFLGTFSKLLLPSLRISFLVLPEQLREAYRRCGGRYSQTASKVEQIALCQYIRDGHLSSQIRKARKLYLGKSRALVDAVREVFGARAELREGAQGLLLPVQFSCPLPAGEMARRARAAGLLVRPLSDSAREGLLLSCTGTPAEEFLPALRLLRRALFPDS